MNTRDERRINGGKRPEEILAEIDRTRDEMDRTLSAIEHRLTPGQLVDQSLDYLRHSGANEFVQNLGGAAKQNPMPVALVGIGLAWLMALGRQPAQHHGETLSSAKERVAGSMDSMRHRAGELTETTKQQWNRARGGIDHLVNEQPLALGAIGLAIGAVLGAAAPRTRVEEQMMGDAARNLAEKAKEVGSQQVDKAAQAAKQATQQETSAPPVQQQPGPTAKGPNKKGAW